MGLSITILKYQTINIEIAIIIKYINQKFSKETHCNESRYQRTYYHFCNDNAPVLQMTSDEKYFSFVVKTEFDTKVRYDQKGVL